MPYWRKPKKIGGGAKAPPLFASAVRAKQYEEHKAPEQTKPPRKPRKPAKLVADMTEAEALRHSQSIAIRQMKAKDAARFSMASDASPAQWEEIEAHLGFPGRSAIVRFVEFSNQLPSGIGTLDKWKGGKQGRIWLSAIFFRRAIQMAKYGENELTSALDEIAISMGSEEYPSCGIDFFVGQQILIVR